MKLKTTATLLILGAFTLLNACGGTSQDPLDENSKVKLGKPVPSNRPDDSTVLKIDGPDYFVMHEGEEQEVTIKSRALLGNAQFKIQLLNPEDFEGVAVTSTPGDELTGQEATLTIKWKVPTGLVAERLAELNFKTQVKTTNLNGNSNFQVVREFPILIYSESTNIPGVTKVVAPTTATREGTTNTFKVYVTDADAADKDGARPTLVFTPDSSNTLNITPVLKIQSVTKDPAVADAWIFDVMIDLKNVELTPEMLVTKFNVIAKSRFDIFSAPVASAFTVWTSVSAPQTSWDEKQAVTFKRLHPNSFTFTVTDPRGEGKLSASFKTSCSNFGATCSCKSVLGATGKAGGMAQCTINWTPAAGSVNQNIEVDMFNQSPVPSDTSKTQLTFTGVINLVD